MSDTSAPRRHAVISDCGAYRYSLFRGWPTGAGRVVFVMLNPSTADANEDDPTIRRCITYAKAWGNDSLEVVNLYALRSTDPRALWKHADPIGPDNWFHLENAVAESLRMALGDEPGRVVCAWGKNAKPARARDVLAMIRKHTVPTALELSKDGTPKHPLYLRGDLRPQPLPPPTDGE